MPSSRLLALPPELRNRIYELVLPLDGTYTALSTASQRMRPHATPALCRTSRVLCAETLPLFRGRNEFCLDILSNTQGGRREPALVRWLRQFRRSGAESLRMLCVWATIVLPWGCGFGGERCKVDVELLVQGGEYYLGVLEWRECPARRGDRDRAWVKGKVREDWVSVVARTMGRELVEMIESLEAGGL